MAGAATAEDTGSAGRTGVATAAAVNDDAVEPDTTRLELEVATALDGGIGDTERDALRGGSDARVLAAGAGGAGTSSAVVTSSESTEKCRSSSPVLMNCPNQRRCKHDAAHLDGM